MAGFLSPTQKAELISQMVSGGLKRTTVGPLTTEYQPPSVTDILKILEAEDAAQGARRRPWILQRHRPPGAVS